MRDDRWLRITAMASSTVMVVAAAVLAGSVGRRDRSWWATVGAFIIALAIVYVAYRLFRSTHYGGPWNT